MYILWQVTDGDTIMTFAYSHIVANVLTKAAAQGRRFKVMVVDCRPELEGQRMLEVCVGLLSADLCLTGGVCWRCVLAC